MTMSAAQRYFLIALIALAALVSWQIMSFFLSPVVLGVVFAVVMHPMYERMRHAFGGRASAAAFATVLAAFIGAVLIVVLLGAQVLGDAENLYASITNGAGVSMLNETAQRVAPGIDRHVPGLGASLIALVTQLDAYVQIVLTWLIQNLGVAFSGVSAFFLDSFIFFFTLFYILRDGVRLRDWLVRVSPLADRDDMRIFDRLGAAVNSVVKGKLTIALAQGTLAGIGFAIFGVPNAIFWGVIAAIASLLPPFGTAIVVYPAAAYLVIVDHIGGAAGLAVWGAVLVGLIDNVLAPKLMSRGTELHPLLVLLSVLGGLAYFGPIGIFLGPIAVSLLLMLLTLHGDASDTHAHTSEG